MQRIDRIDILCMLQFKCLIDTLLATNSLPLTFPHRPWMISFRTEGLSSGCFFLRRATTGDTSPGQVPSSRKVACFTSAERRVDVSRCQRWPPVVVPGSSTAPGCSRRRCRSAQRPWTNSSSYPRRSSWALLVAVATVWWPRSYKNDGLPVGQFH